MHHGRANNPLNVNNLKLILGSTTTPRAVKGSAKTVHLPFLEVSDSYVVIIYILNIIEIKLGVPTLPFMAPGGGGSEGEGCSSH